MSDNDLTKNQKDYAIFLPAISSFYAAYIGKQRFGEYVEKTRMPAQIPDMEQLNWLNPSKALFPYRWSLYSAGHADLDLSRSNPKEDMIRNRDANTVMLADSGGFQIAKGIWEGEWKDPNSKEVKDKMAECHRRKTEIREVVDKQGNTKQITVDLVKEYSNKLKAAEDRRKQVLNWQMGIATYGLTMDIPTWTFRDPKAASASGITSYDDAVAATKYNNEYWINNRKGDLKILNVLQGGNHDEADHWYDLMKDYCDPNKYPGRHFNGWGMGGQNMCDVQLVLRRLVHLIHDGLLEPGVHDWMHFLGTSKLEWAVLLTSIQRAVREYHNPNFTISFDCASPFLATANGQLYNEITTQHRGKWSYRMGPTADDKKYSLDSRDFGTAVRQDNIHPAFLDSPVSARLKISDICHYQPGMLNKNGKEGKTSWDSFSYALLMSHNVWMHISAVQEANRVFDNDRSPDMMLHPINPDLDAKKIIDQIFAANDRKTSLDIIEKHSKVWDRIIGTRGFTGKKTTNPHSRFNSLFQEQEDSEPAPDEELLDSGKLEELENFS